MKNKLRFDEITDDGRLWAVCYEEDRNVLDQIYQDWSDITFLEAFFEENRDDLAAFFKITDVDKAIYDTIQDDRYLECLILDIRPDTDLDRFFRPLNNLQRSEKVLSKEKAKGIAISSHPSWLRLYAIRFGPGCYLITGGTIKLTRTMEERKHTLAELTKMEKVRNYLLDNGVCDFDGFVELNTEYEDND